MANTKRGSKSKAAPTSVAELGERLDALESVERRDGWANVATGLGIAGRDKRLGATFSRAVMTKEDADELYRGNDMAATIVDLPADELVREWVDVAVDQGEEDDGDGVSALSASMADRLEELGAQEAFGDSERWARLFGGSSIVVGADDGQSPIEPLREDGIKRLDWLTVLDAREIYPVAWYDHPFEPKFGLPRLYNITPQVGTTNVFNAQIHESRIIRFDGVKLSRVQQRRNENNGWGDSVLNRVHGVLRDFDQSWDGAAHLVHDFAQAVFKMAGLAQLLAAKKDDVVTRRIQSVDAVRSLVRSIVVDKDDDFTRQATPLTHLPEMLEKFFLRLAAAARMPVTLLAGQAPAGLNATGESDIRFFYDRVRARQRTYLVPRLERLVRLIWLCKTGPSKGVEPEGWSLTPRPLWQPSDKEKAETRKLEVEADQIEIDAGVVLPEEVAVHRHKEDGMVDLKTRRELLDSDKPLEPGAGDDPAADPATVGDDGKPADDQAVDPQSALNGAQVMALLEILKAIGGGEIPRETGVAAIEASFPLSREQADQVVGELGRGFKPKPAEPAPAPFGGARPFPPKAPPAGDEEPKPTPERPPPTSAPGGGERR